MYDTGVGLDLLECFELLGLVGVTKKVVNPPLRMAGTREDAVDPLSANYYGSKAEEYEIQGSRKATSRSSTRNAPYRYW
jgi:hypothetical protein